MFSTRWESVKGGKALRAPLVDRTLSKLTLKAFSRVRCILSAYLLIDLP